MLDRVTVTGADDSVRPSDLVKLSKRFPFVEWGILVSAARFGTARFPSQGWLKALRKNAKRYALKLSAHFCGRWVCELLLNKVSLKPGLVEGFQRAQLNFHGFASTVKEGFAEAILDAFDNRQVIFQIDGNKGLDYLRLVGDGKQAFDPVPLFDTSHGTGVLPKKWPKPLDDDVYHGYAGGLGPDNLEGQLPRISKAAGAARFWVDMETKVRSDYDKQFDLAKVRRCLEICEPFMKKVAK